MTYSGQNRESQLRELVQRYELVFKATNDVVYDLDLARGIIEWNDAFYTRYGYKKTEITKTLKWWASRIHPEDLPLLEIELNEWLAGKNDIRKSEYRFKKVDGSYVYIKDRSAMQRADNGTPVRIIGTFLDVTRRRQLEHAKHEFISLVSHQLRTPLTAIRVYSDMLSSGMFGNLSDVQQRYADQVSDASIRLIEQVEDVVHIARIELGQTVSHPLSVNVSEQLEAVIAEISDMAQKKNVHLEYKISDTIRNVELDEVIFRQIVRQLLVNAIRFAGVAEGKVFVKCSKMTNGYRISVKSMGEGVPGDQADVFAKFYNAQTTMVTDEHDAGLGLYSVNLLARAVECVVSIKNHPGESVIFNFDIPGGGMKRID